MAHLHCSNDLLKQLGAAPAQTEALPLSAPGRLGDWCVSMIPLGKRNAALFMNQATQLSFIILEGQRFDVQAMAQIFWGGLSSVLALHGVQSNVAEAVVDSYAELVLAKTPNASLTAQMSSLARDYKQLVAAAGSIERCDVGAVIQSLNQRPRKGLNFATPQEAVFEFLKAAAA